MTLIDRTLGRTTRLLVPLIRTPLVVLDDRLVTPVLGGRSPAHRVLDAATGLLDSVGGRAPDTARAAAAQQAAADRSSARGEPASTRVAELADELIADQRDDRFVGELADDELRRVQAEVRAKQLLEDPDHR